MKNGHAERPKNVQADRGLTCRQCGWRRFRVIYTRAALGGKVVRRRECRNCRTRVTTWERAIGFG
jgi:transcriptional regulator NrdR family protein